MTLIILYLVYSQVSTVVRTLRRCRRLPCGFELPFDHAQTIEVFSSALQPPKQKQHYRQYHVPFCRRLLLGTGYIKTHGISIAHRKGGSLDYAGLLRF